jgi:hypothetical protein
MAAQPRGKARERGLANGDWGHRQRTGLTQRRRSALREREREHERRRLSPKLGLRTHHAWRALEHIIGSARPRHLKAALVSAAALADELGVPALRGRAISTISSALDKEAFRVALRDLALGVLDLKRVNEAMSYSWQEPVATALARAARRDSYRVYKHLNIRTRARPRLREDVWCHIIESALMTSSPIAAAITTELRQLKP